MNNVSTRDQREAAIRTLTHNDFNKLTNYLQSLSPDTKRRFGPHPFDRISVELFHKTNPDVTGYVALSNEETIVAYALLKQGYIDEDLPRFARYNITPQPATDCTFAPSVADAWQSCGLGKHLFHFILADCKLHGYTRLVLWGGVQSTNTKAVNYYQRLGFINLGVFEHNGPNDDMMLII